MCEFCDSLSGYKKEKVEKGMRHEHRVKIAIKHIRGESLVSTETLGPSYELNYCPECGKKLSQLRACPFCGQEVACARMVKRDDEERWFVVCGVGNGCGASSGWYDSVEEAEAAWNRRAKP